jgi:hypothetical protein
MANKRAKKKPAAPPPVVEVWVGEEGPGEFLASGDMRQHTTNAWGHTAEGAVARVLKTLARLASQDAAAARKKLGIRSEGPRGD